MAQIGARQSRHCFEISPPKCQRGGNYTDTKTFIMAPSVNMNRERFVAEYSRLCSTVVERLLSHVWEHRLRTTYGCLSTLASSIP